ncbi:MAG: glycine cleavage system protein GcvH [bacterium]|nr:glycine cleavage system protein GcvH [bacterium]
MNAEELLYAETHEWAFVEDADGGKLVTVGISPFAVEQLTDIVFLELPETGKPVTQGGEFGEVESVKSVNSVYSPVTGEIVEVNTDLPNELEKLNDDPLNAGWLVKIKLTDESSVESLMDYAAYQTQCAESEDH